MSSVSGRFGKAAAIALCTIGWLLATATLRADEIRVGAAAVEINPPNGISMAGYYHPRGCQGVLDDLLVKATVLDDGQTVVALVVCDLISVPRDVVVKAREIILQKVGISGAAVMISATHTHTGPSLTRGAARSGPDGGPGDLSREYTQKLPEWIAQAVAEAHAARVPARVSFGRESQSRLAFNRRFWMRDGTVGWNPGKLNPKIIRPIGPIDPQVAVVYAVAADGKPLLTYVNYAMHPDTTGGLLTSADYPGALARRLAEYRGPEMTTIFANGACGDINHLNVQWAERQQGPQEANRLGTILSAAVLQAYMDLQPVRAIRLDACSQVVELPLAEATEEDLRQAQQIAARGGEATFMERVQAYKVLDLVARKGEPLEAEVQVVTLGRDLAWVGLPGEIFVALGLSIKAASPFGQTHVVELANGSVGYVPSRSAYAEGQYEVVSARCAEGSGEMLVAAAVRMLGEMYGKTEPESP
ncbi:MAG: hypothetical protein JXB62_22015 [Pirellulales bacterium]|nr:hypothetical protein [Pirellulales bacterium]